MILEEIRLPNGEKVKRVKVSILLSLAFLCIPVGLLLALYLDYGYFLILTLCPFLIVYVFIREIFFAGKDSAAAAITSFVVEEVLKSKLQSTMTKKKKEKR
jgi:hypothetical protein